MYDWIASLVNVVRCERLRSAHITHLPVEPVHIFAGWFDAREQACLLLRCAREELVLVRAPAGLPVGKVVEHAKEAYQTPPRVELAQPKKRRERK